jgi:two-component system, NarL family, sensor histidine kinase UhpB
VPHQRQFLLIEDDEDRAALLNATLKQSRKREWRLERARSIDEGRRRLKAVAFDAALVDLGVPDAQGTLGLTELSEEFADTALIVLARTVDEALAAEVLRLGAFDFLADDEIAPRTLARTLRQAVARRVAREQWRRSAEDLKRSQKRLEEAQRVARVGSWEWDVETGRVEWSDEHWRIFGMSPRAEGGLSAEEAFAHVHPDDLVRLREITAVALREQGEYATHVRILGPDGSVRTVLSRGAAVVESGRSARLVGVALDVSELVEATAERDQLRREAVESRTAMQALARRLLEVQEEERREIARELHDEAGQLLAGLKLLLESEELRRPGAHHEELRSTVDTLMAHIRGLAIRLRPPMLDHLGIAPTLGWYVGRLGALAGVDVGLTIDPGAARRFGPAVELAAYRVVQEALTNVARHSGAGRATVEVWTEGFALLLRVSDPGRGFLPADPAAGTSLGLLCMRERCAAVGGRLEVTSRPGHGTTVLVSLPISHEVAP